MLLSLSTLLWILVQTYLSQKIPSVVFFVVLMIAAPLLIYSLRSKHEETRDVRKSYWDPLTKDLLVVGSLCFWGWTSLLPYLISIQFAQVLSMRKTKKQQRFIVPLICGSGLIASYFCETWLHGQYWASFDQLWRSGIGNSLVSWGFNDHVGAVGFRLNYHWLAEGVAGFIARFTPSSVVVAATKIVPLLGVVIVVDLFEELARRYKIDGRSSKFATFIVLVACNQFDLYSIGSLWGIGLFMMGIITMLDIWRMSRVERKIFGGQFVMLLMLFPLIMISQATLGINFFVLVVALAVALVVKRPEVWVSAAILVFLSGGIALVVRATILAAPEEFYQQPSISLSHFLNFRGTDSYVGNNQIFIMFSSVLYLLGMVQMFGGLMLGDYRVKGQRELFLSLSTLFFTCFVLANVFSIGGIDAQQIRFLQPMLVFGSWFSCVFWYRQFQSVLDIVAFRLKLTYVGLLMLFSIALIGLQTMIYMSNWSVKRTLGIGLWISICSVVVVTVGFALMTRRKIIKRAALLTVLGCLILSAHGPTLKKSIIRTILTDRNSELTKYVGSDSTQRCISYVVKASSREAILASNFFRIPLSTRDEKYFLLSAFSGRRAYVDGPLYVQIPRPTWLQERVSVSDGFGANPTRETKNKLLEAGVSLFFVSKTETTRQSWLPFAETVYEDDDCLVLALNKSNVG